MAQFNYGIDCDSEKNAAKLKKYIESINIVQDGLDIYEGRLSVISNQHLIEEIEKFSKKNEGALRVEIWSIDQEFDEAESEGKLKVVDFDGKATSRQSSVAKVAKFKSYSGVKENVDKFKSWLISFNPEQLSIISNWEPEVEFGSYGIEFECADLKFDKVANKEWMSKGVITEKLKK